MAYIKYAAEPLFLFTRDVHPHVCLLHGHNRFCFPLGSVRCPFPRPEPVQVIRLLHQRRRGRGIDLRGGEPLVPHLLLNHGHRYPRRPCIYQMDVPEDIGRDLLCGELLGQRILDPGLFGQPIYGPEHSLCAQVARAPAGEEPILARLQALPYGLQSTLAHPGGTEMAGLGPAALNPDEPVMKIDFRNPGGDHLPRSAAQVVGSNDDQTAMSNFFAVRVLEPKEYFKVSNNSPLMTYSLCSKDLLLR